MRVRGTIVGILIIGAALAALATLAPEGSPAPAPVAVAPVVRVARAESIAAAAQVSTSCESALPESARAAIASLAIKAGSRVAVARASERLEEELLATPPGADRVALRVGLERLLRERPWLAPGAARAFARLEDRETLFVVSRALAICVDQPEVRAVLDEAAAVGPASRREVALIALPADARALELSRRALDDASAAPAVRAAGAWSIARGFDLLAAQDKDRALSTARALAGAPAEDGHARAESLHLLARSAAPQDGRVAASVLAEPGAPAEVALAAAHLALATGADRAQVAAALSRNTAGACGLAASLLTRSGP